MMKQKGTFETTHYRVTVHSMHERLWTFEAGRRTFSIEPPVFEIEGRPVVCAYADFHFETQKQLKHGVWEFSFRGRVRDIAVGHLILRLVLRVAQDSPILRFRYELSSESGLRMTRTTGVDVATYLRYSIAGMPSAKEVRFSEFHDLVHAFRLSELPLSQANFDAGMSTMGPMLVAEGFGTSMLLAYEHGSQVPDAFVKFVLTGDRSVSVSAVKGNVVAGKTMTEQDPFVSPWFHIGAVAGDEAELAAAYRDFVLKFMSQNATSRTPYIFYNSWAYQERNKWWNDKTFLDSMNEERMLLEIDIAHRMGIDVFVIDTGWYEKTGDWRVSSKRFPRGLAPIKQKLDGYGMKLGLWFDNAAAISSRILADHKDCVMSWQGKKNEPYEVWETEAAHRMCLVSRYADAFADELVRLVREVGVTYFKWDAIGQYGCDDPHHFHGTEANTPRERADSYAFQQVSFMTKIVDKLCAACPEAIVDFDITEGGRSVGLAFLSAGKYFLINNGPYFNNYDVSYDWRTGKLMGGESRWSNIFVNPGPARGWICRTPLDFDKWIPSVLFLTHYLPDEPADSQWINLASLMLGQNGIWGDLAAISPEGVERFGKWLALYKKVRDDITSASPVRYGSVGGSPEIHQKISSQTGRGLVSIFAGAAGTFEYLVEGPTAETFAAIDGLTVKKEDDRTRITAVFEKPGAKFVLFGV